MEVTHLDRFEMQSRNKEEILPDFSEGFPYVATCAELDSYLPLGAPWHWHRTVELFYVKSGCVSYSTPNGHWVFPAGSGGMVNANVLHASGISPANRPNIQLLHQFDPVFLAGAAGNALERKYILPVTASGLELLPLFPEHPEERNVLEKIRAAFAIDDRSWGYEFRLRQALTEIWLLLYSLAMPFIDAGPKRAELDAGIKALMVYVHEHYQQPISIDALAASAHVSRRVCFRLFAERLHMTPVAYIREYRLQKACQMLAQTEKTVTQIAYDCGLGSSSYFGKQFRAYTGSTPQEYRRTWHDRDNHARK